MEQGAGTAAPLTFGHSPPHPTEVKLAGKSEIPGLAPYHSTPITKGRVGRKSPDGPVGSHNASAVQHYLDNLCGVWAARRSLGATLGRTMGGRLGKAAQISMTASPSNQIITPWTVSAPLRRPTVQTN